METSSRMLGLKHSSTLTSKTSFALTYGNLVRLKEVEELEVQVMETSSRVLGLEYLNMLTSMDNLKLTFSSQGR